LKKGLKKGRIMGVNNLTLLGNFGRDPEEKVLKNGDTLCRFSVGVGELVKGEQKTTWFNCVAFGSKAQYILRSCQKGSGVFVEGPFRSEEYEGKVRWTMFVNNIVVYSNRKPGNDHGKS
jgi:single-strand DNA-binding protein